ncbi:spermatogenesis-associated protein 1 [Platysternon megacephalum]|uniref:Spermatogenesis-associated protein 1 n=1 Tax=Platysternon megacephalum TaxID=55544 RepID=A0A4D9EL44_9SAUR|nr:spermatogenesis-associated protein 1 [Platysternon megacephalum]
MTPLNLAYQNNVITSVKEIDYVVRKALRYYRQRSVNPGCTVFTLVCECVLLPLCLDLEHIVKTFIQYVNQLGLPQSSVWPVKLSFPLVILTFDSGSLPAFLLGSSPLHPSP